VNIPLRAYWQLLATYIKPQKTRFALLVVLLLSGIGMQVINPQIVRAFIDAVIAGESGRTLSNEAVAFILIALLQQSVAVAATYMGENVAWTATNALRAHLMRHCLDLDLSFHNAIRPGELIQRIDGDVTQLSTFFSKLVIRVSGNLLLLVGILVALLREDWRISLIFAVFSMIMLFVLYRLRSIAVPHQKALRQAEADLYGYIEEQLNGTEDIRAAGAIPFVINGLYRHHANILIHDTKSSQKNWFIGFVSGSLLMLGYVIALVFGFILNKAGVMTVGTVYLLMNYVNLLSNPIRELTWQLENLQTVGASVERLTELTQRSSLVTDGPLSATQTGPLTLTFDDVSFAYMENEPVLRNISFCLEAGRVLGLLGRTGSGKTTVTRLIFRFYDASTGQIQINSSDLKQYNRQSIRNRIGLVTQDVQLFKGTVRENITLFDVRIPDEDIHAAIAELELTDWYQDLSDGLDTVIDADGKNISAGEAQLLALTRVFLRNPGMIVLDEASSRLDPATEQRIERAIDHLLQNRTTLIIAHRVSTLHRADEIMILEDGMILEHGNREMLAADESSQYHAILQSGQIEVLA
jgi:ATP-binding cassette subfamily B protein